MTGREGLSKEREGGSSLAPAYITCEFFELDEAAAHVLMQLGIAAVMVAEGEGSGWGGMKGEQDSHEKSVG